MQHPINFIDSSIPLKPYTGPDLLADKRNQAIEIVVEFFDHCNLKCVFCWQDHDAKKSIHDITDHIEKAIGIMANFSNERFDVCMMGGEVFNDDLDDKMFEIYEQEILRIEEYAKANNKVCSYRLVTNLVFENTERVKGLINRLSDAGLEIRLATSYDPTGRFNPKTLKSFMRNIVDLKDYIREVAFVLTKPTIKSILKDDDENFKFLYDSGYQLFFDYYSPYTSSQTPLMTPSDMDLLECFIFLIKNYPNTYPIKDWIDREWNELSCRTSHIILSSGQVGQCRVCGVSDDEYETPVDLYDKREMEETFIIRNRCFECEYYGKCSMTCFLLADYKKRERLTECIYKIIYDYITKGIEPEDNPRFINAKRYFPGEADA